MKTKLALTAALILALSVVGVAMGNGNSGPKATGGFTGLQNGTVPVQVAFNAQPDADGYWAGGLPVTGKGVVNSRSDTLISGVAVFDFKGKVYCYYQDGNKAWFSGEILRGDSNRTYFLIGVVDNSEPEDTDTFRIRVTNVASQANCRNSGSFPLNSPVSEGNIQVHQVANNG